MACAQKEIEENYSSFERGLGAAFYLFLTVLCLSL